MILIDSNVLIALCDDQDELHLRAARDLDELEEEQLFVPEPVMVEVLFAVRAEYLRKKLRRVMELWGMEPWREGDLGRLWRRAMEWSQEYAEHHPDWADAYIVALCARHRGIKVWTYDEEFWKVWRRPDGSGIPMAV